MNTAASVEITTKPWWETLPSAITAIILLGFDQRRGAAAIYARLGRRAEIPSDASTSVMRSAWRNAVDMIKTDKNACDPNVVNRLETLFEEGLRRFDFATALVGAIKKVRQLPANHRAGGALALKAVIEGSFVPLGDISHVVEVMGEELTYFQATCTAEGSEQVAEELEACMTILQLRIGALPEEVPPAYQVARGHEGNEADI